MHRTALLLLLAPLAAPTPCRAQAPAATATTVRIRDGRQQVVAGPFSRSNEQMCAYELVECASMDAAVRLALTHPMAKAATIEVRPIWPELAVGQAVSSAV